MHVTDLYTIIVTDKRAECRDFYVRWFGFQVVFEASWFVYLAAAGDHPFGVAFMAPDHPSQPPGPERFGGRGLLITKDEPWGQRRFALVDPAGAWVDVIQTIDPVPGFWDKYLA